MKPNILDLRVGPSYKLCRASKNWTCMGFSVVTCLFCLTRTRVHMLSVCNRIEHCFEWNLFSSEDFNMCGCGLLWPCGVNCKPAYL